MNELFHVRTNHVSLNRIRSNLFTWCLMVWLRVCERILPIVVVAVVHVLGSQRQPTITGGQTRFAIYYQLTLHSCLYVKWHTMISDKWTSTWCLVYICIYLNSLNPLVSPGSAQVQYRRCPGRNNDWLRVYECVWTEITLGTLLRQLLLIHSESLE